MIALRLDDVGASSKRYEVYSDRVLGISGVGIPGNLLFLKYLPGFKKWGPYRELTAREWYDIWDLLERYGAKLTVAVTAAWAGGERKLIPFPKRFPREAVVLKEGLARGLIEVANHGLTHCVLKDSAFRPRWRSSNRRYHREFWEWVPPEVQEEHLRRSQEILQEWFETDIVTFVPPGNVFTDVTLELAERHGLRYVSCDAPRRIQGRMVIIGNDGVRPFHDRDIVLNGTGWLRELIAEQKHGEFCFIKELGVRVGAHSSQGRPART